MEGARIETEESQDWEERLTALVQGLTGYSITSPADDWVFVTPEELQETYPVPSAFEAYVKEVLEKRRQL